MLRTGYFSGKMRTEGNKSLVPRLSVVAAATVLALIVAVLSISGSQAGAQTGGTARYAVTDLGVLPDGWDSEAHALNGSGQVVGRSSDADSPEVAFLYENGEMKDLGTLTGGTYSSAEGINDSGQVAGWSDTTNSRYRAFLRQDGAMTDLGTLLDGTGHSETPYAESQAHDVNDDGQVVGWSQTSPDGSSQLWRHAFLWQNGQMRDLGLLAPEGSPGESEAYAVNDLGQVVGESDREDFNGTHAFLWQDGEMIDLGTLDGSNFSVAYDINGSGQVVGESSGSGFIWQNDTMTRLDGIEPRAINDAGQVVGSTCVFDGGEGCEDRAVIHEDGQAKDLNDLVDPAFGWTLGAATDINEEGQIVGTGTVNGESRAFLLTPNPDATDTTPPKLELPGDITEEATSKDGAEVAFTATATDENPANPEVTCDPPSGSTFPLGETNVECAATDAANNTATGSFKVIVADTTAPALDLPDDIVAEAQSADGAPVSFQAVATDAVDDAPDVTCTPASDGTFPPGETTVNCSATDVAGNRAEGSFGITVQDTTAPDTTIESGPDGPTNDTTPTFTFGGSDAASADLLFSYKLDNGEWSPYSTVKSVTLGGEAGLSEGEHTFYVRAKDGAGNEDASPAEQGFTIDTTAPTATIDSGPSGTVPIGSASFEFSSDEPGATFECSLDGGSFFGCVSPKQYTVLPAGEHTFEVRAKDAAGNIGPAASRSWTIATPTAKLVSVTPGASATDVSTNANVTATFSGPINAAAVSDANFKLSAIQEPKCGGKGACGGGAGSAPKTTPWQAAVSYNAATNTATLDPKKLDPSTTYQVYLNGKAIGLTQGRIWRFTTGNGEEEVTGVTPADGATGVAASANITATFSTDMKASSFGQSTFALIDMTDGKTISGQISYSSATRTATFDPKNPLLPGHFYEAVLVGDGDRPEHVISKEKQKILDAEDNPLSLSKFWRFTVDVAEPGGLASVSPAPSATGVSTTTNVTATFSGPINAGALNFTLAATEEFSFKHATGGNPNNPKATPWPATVDYDAATNTATLDPKANLEPNTLYRARITGQLPGGEWWFTTGDGEDEVVDVTPADGATGVSATTDVTATFSRHMKASSFSKSTFTLVDLTGAGKKIAGHISYHPATGTSTATFDPEDPLSPGHTYEATLVGYDKGSGKMKQTVEDAEGYALPFSKSWTFTVAITEPGGLVSVTPAPAATGVPAATNVTATFADQINAGALTGADFKLLEVKGCYSFSCAASHAGGASSGVKTKTPVAAKFSYDPATNTVTLDPDKPLAVDATYEARIYGKGLGFTGGEWWFTVGGEDEVTGVTPADGATGVAASANVTATFSTDMEAKSFTQSAFTLIDQMDGSKIAGSVTYDAATRTVTFDPKVPLLPGRVYEATLVPAGKGTKSGGVRDAEGNPLSAEKTWRFTVEIADP